VSHARTHAHTHTHTPVNMVTCVAADVLPSGWAKPQHFSYVAVGMSDYAGALRPNPSYAAAGVVFMCTCWQIIRALTTWISRASFLVLHFTLCEWFAFVCLYVTPFETRYLARLFLTDDLHCC
jgi:hypothetical protein